MCDGEGGEQYSAVRSGTVQYSASCSVTGAQRSCPYALRALTLTLHDGRYRHRQCPYSTDATDAGSTSMQHTLQALTVPLSILGGLAIWC
jgi:hypothetical protein